jgi:hypothetical protein
LDARQARLASASFARAAQLAASCITRAVFARIALGDGQESLTLGVPQPVVLPSPQRYALSASLAYGPWSSSSDGAQRGVRVTGYMFALDDADGKEILAYHWHPSGLGRRREPHLHLGAGAQVGLQPLGTAHRPTGMVALHEFIRLLIADLGVRPIRSDWQDILEAGR